MNLQEQAARLSELKASLIDLGERAEELTDDDEARYQAELSEFDELRERHDQDWERAATFAAKDEVLRNFNAGQYEDGDSLRDRGAPNVVLERDPYDESYQREVGFAEAAKRSIGEHKRMDSDAQQEASRKMSLAKTDVMHMRGMEEYFLAHSSDSYTRGWMKLVSGNGHMIEADERHALQVATRYRDRWDPERGITLTAANGGALIPAHLDPTVVLTNNGAANPFRMISRVVPMNVNTWNGVTSAGVTMAVSTEGGDSSDVAPTFVQKSIPCFKFHGTIPVTIEAFEDIEGLSSELTRELADAKDRIECEKFTKGVGTTEPTGIVTAVYAVSTRRANHATNSAMTVTDITDAQNALAPRFQPNASWIASLTYLNRARLLGSSSYSTWSATFDQPLASNILGKPAYEASDMSTALSSITNTAFVYGDFNHFVIPERIGMSIELVPHLTSGNFLPNGRRGFYAYWRVGSDAVSVTAFVVSSNPGA